MPTRNKHVQGFVPFQATPYFLVFIALEILINFIRFGGKLKEPRSNDAFSSLAAGLASQIPL